MVVSAPTSWQCSAGAAGRSTGIAPANRPVLLLPPPLLWLGTRPASGQAARSGMGGAAGRDHCCRACACACACPLAAWPGLPTGAKHIRAGEKRCTVGGAPSAAGCHAAASCVSGCVGGWRADPKAVACSCGCSGCWSCGCCCWGCLLSNGEGAALPAASLASDSTSALLLPLVSRCNGSPPGCGGPPLSCR